MKTERMALAPVGVRKSAGKATRSHRDRKALAKRGYSKHKNRRFS